jgi:hypothetical protein
LEYRNSQANCCWQATGFAAGNRGGFLVQLLVKLKHGTGRNCTPKTFCLVRSGDISDFLNEGDCYLFPNKMQFTAFFGK